MRKSSVLLAAVGVLCAASAAWSWWQLRAERQRVATLEQQLASMPATPQSAVLPVPAALASSAPAPAPTAAPASPADPEAAREKEVRNMIRASQVREREMMKEPDYRKARVDEMRRRLAPLRADAIRVAGLTPEQADRLVELQVERTLHYWEVVQEPGQQPTQAEQAEMARFSENQQAELRALLGTEKYERWNLYQASAEERAEVSQFRASLTGTEPLNDRQADALAEAMYAERQRRTQEYEEYVKSAGITDRNIVSPQDRQRWLDLEKQANQRILDAVAGTLSPAQLASLDESRATRLVPVENALRMQLEGRLAKSP